MYMTSMAFVYLPIEFRSRELDGKVALALELFERGITVVFGQQWAIYDNFHRLPAGVVLFKSQNLIHHQAMKLAREAGHRVVSLEEESLALTSSQAILRNCPAATYELADCIMATGEFEFHTHLSAGCRPEKLVVTGNPRIDLLKPCFSSFYAADVTTLKKSLGSFILINTNFGLLNSKWGSIEAVKQIEIRAGGLDPKDPKSVAIFEQAIETEIEHQKSISLFIVVRPHPSESLDPAKKHYENIENVKVTRLGPHVPWTLAADCLIHTSCTTGLEAAIAGRVAFSLVTNESWISRSILSNQANPTYQRVDLLAEEVKAVVLKEKKVAMPELGTLKNLIFNIQDESAVNGISDVIESRCVWRSDVSFRKLQFRQRPAVLLEKFNVHLDEAIKVVNGLFASGFYKIKEAPTVNQLGDSLFVISGSGRKMTTTTPPRL
jgi:surface carbohydrate biosynthesis protein